MSKFGLETPFAVVIAGPNRQPSSQVGVVFGGFMVDARCVSLTARSIVESDQW
jgi:hypothetical protein